MNVVIFGLGPQSTPIWYILTHDSPHRVIGFTVDETYRTATIFHDLPLVPFERVEEYFPPPACGMFVPLGWKRMNGLRAEKFTEGKAKGYAFISYISSRAMIWPNVRTGENCVIQDGAIVQPFARIGDNCNLRSACIVSHHAVISDHCFIGSRAVVGDGAMVGERCVLGLNSTVCDGVKIAPGCFIGTGAVVTTDTEEQGVYVGVPARRRA